MPCTLSVFRLRICFLLLATGILSWAISVFCREADENCALLGYYPVSSGNFLPTFRDNLSVPFSQFKNKKSLNPEDGTDRLSRNAAKKLPLLA